MRLYAHFGINPWLLVGISGLALTCNQACANGDTKQKNSETGAVGETNSGGAGNVSGGGGNSGQGGNAIGGAGNSSASGGIGQGGSGNDTGGSPNGGTPSTGGEAPVTGGASDGGNPNTGGVTADVGGTSATGGATSTGGMLGTGGTPANSCTTALDCVSAPNNQSTCDSSTGTCVQCVGAADCVADFGANNDCISKKCVSYTPCATSADCPNNNACDTTKGRCVACAVDTDCASGQKCVSNTCRTSCLVDNTCAPSGTLCNTTLGICVQCGCAECSAAKLTCTGGLVCDPTGACSPPVCNAGDQICASSGGIATCLSDGSGYGTPAACPANSACQAVSGAIACYNNGSADGGNGDDCAVGGNPCQQIPKFIGTQTLDGLGNDFCNVPSALFDAQNAAKVIAYNATPLEIATVRIAWSSSGIHAFIDVLDASVQTVYGYLQTQPTADQTQAITDVYQGDSIELMISSSNAVTGLTGNDANTLHVIVPASGPAVSVKTSNANNSSQGTQTALPSNNTLYAQKITSTGYSIELELPWPGNNSPSTGATVRFDMSLNSADSNFTSISNMRDGQLVYYLGSVTGTTTCEGLPGSDAPIEPFCDDRAWCATSL